ELRRGQERDRFLGVLLGVARQVERADVLVARGLVAAARVRVAPALVLVALDGVRLDRAADLRDHLLGEAAVGRGEGLPLAVAGVDRLRVADALDRPGRTIRGDEVGDLRLERDLERILDDRRLERSGGRWSSVELGRAAQRGRRRLRDAN